MQNGQFEEALTFYRQWEKLLETQTEDNWFSNNDWHRYGQALVKTGKDSMGRALIRKQISINRYLMENDHFYPLYDTAGIYAFMNMPDSAYYFLDKLHDSDGLLRGPGTGNFILVDFQYDNIRSDKKFIEGLAAAKEKMREIRRQVAAIDPEYVQTN